MQNYMSLKLRVFHFRPLTYSFITIIGIGKGEVGQGCTDFPKICEAPHNSRRQKGNMKQVPYWGTIVYNLVAWAKWCSGLVHLRSPCA
jgi:hypothetical protein